MTALTFFLLYRWDRKDVDRLSGPPLYCTMDGTAFFYRDNRIEPRALNDEERAEVAKVSVGRLQ